MKESQIDNHERVVSKMGTYEAFFAVVKGYCAINILLLPKSFANGGYIFSPVSLILSSCLQCACAVFLSKIALKTGVFNYPEIAGKAMGPKGRIVVRLLLIFTHF